MRTILIILLLTLSSCGVYQYQPVDKCCETDVVYLDEIKGDSVNIFTSLDFNTITLDFRPRFHRNYDWYWGRTYGYWGNRPLWMDFDFHFGNYYSYYNPYYSFNRPWNYWDWYMRPWRPYQHNYWSWYNGPWHNQGYNVVYNASRRGFLTQNWNRRNNISNKIVTNRTKPRVIVNKPNNNIVIKPNNNNVRPNNNYNNIRVKPNNNSRPNYNNNNSRPNYNNNSRPSYNNSRPVINNSRPVNNNSRPVNNSRSVKGPR